MLPIITISLPISFCVSIGHGEIDLYLLDDVMPKMKHYVGVESDRAIFAHLSENMRKTHSDCQVSSSSFYEKSLLIVVCHDFITP